MQNLTPIPRDQRPSLPAFAPVPRKARHDGWTPDRQRAFIEALADTGSVTTAARMVNMSTEGAYFLRRQPGAEGFRQAWEAALDMGVLRLKDEAFDRAMNGQLVPVFVAGKLMGYRRKKNDRLLMFCLRHYGHDATGKRTTINYFSRREQSSPAPQGRGTVGHRPMAEGPQPQAALQPPGQSSAHASTTTIRTTHTTPDRTSAASRTSAETVATFEGVPLDDEAQAAIAVVLEACAARQRALAPEDDPEVPWVGVAETGTGYSGEFEATPGLTEYIPFAEGEVSWEILDDKDQLAAIETVREAMEAHRRLSPEERAALEAAEQAAIDDRIERDKTRQALTDYAATQGEHYDVGDWRNYK